VKERIKTFFELNTTYKFDPTDVTAIIYVVCTVLCALGLDYSILMLIGATIGTAFCWRAHRINLVVLNITLLIFNLICLF
jgi:hypothetical protein